jgi:hypothetical protein
MGDPRLAARSRLPHEPRRPASGVDRGGRRGVCRLGGEARGARIRDRRHRRQGRLLRPAGDARVSARAASLRPRVQVGADRRDHAAAGDPCSRRAHGGAQPARRARAGAGRRRDRLQRDAAQRGRHSAKGHSRRRPRRGTARGRRDPTGGRARG